MLATYAFLGFVPVFYFHGILDTICLGIEKYSLEMRCMRACLAHSQTLLHKLRRFGFLSLLFGCGVSHLSALPLIP
uniref:Uncharacterized protein n=1 Tax=Arundo donax TaxID=35708 RepID=A0A0A9HEC8_ARUDO